jgi:hypothetical protein
LDLNPERFDMAPPLAQDKRAGFTGLVVGAVFLLIVLYGIVHLTNVHYAGREGGSGGKAAAAETR